MRKILMTAAAVGLVAFSASPLSAQDMKAPEGERAEFTAQVVDLSCKTALDASGEAHRECAQICAKNGIPLGLMTEDGKFYLPVSRQMGQNAGQALFDHAEKKVRVKGEVITRGGMNAIILDAEGGITPVS